MYFIQYQSVNRTVVQKGLEIEEKSTSMVLTYFVDRPLLLLRLIKVSLDIQNFGIITISKADINSTQVKETGGKSGSSLIENIS